MAIVSLRAYNHEIEGMIDNGQLDEAVAHCRHILATFPKHIASYRLLGKAHLEQQRISDATDIFQRVLSAIPDDFISNVGMSIIREDENNLDAAIWHMELAYEAQPANIAIQDELRRLYGRRDGMQPPKVRLTRGALARMYAKGGLFDQAIAELRAAIAEDPNRPDLQLLLAQMFFQTSQRIEAVDTCVTILKKMPLCLEANRILAVSLPEAENSEAVKNSRQIVISMDPYYAFAEPEAITSDLVSESAVNIERLEWKSGLQVAEIPSQPNWATSLGISMDKPTEENIPDWLKAAEAPATQSPDEKSSPGVSPFIWDTQEVEKIITDTSKPEGEIPDWMKDAGWKPATGESIPPAGEVVSPGEENTATPPNDDLQKAEIPEWLRGIAPDDFTGTEGQQTLPEEDTLSNPWLEPHQPGPTDSIIHWLEDKQPEVSKTPPAQESSFAFAPDDEVPDWLKDLDVPSAAEERPIESAAASTSLPSAFLDEPVTPAAAEIETTSVDKAVEPAEELAPDLSEIAPSQETTDIEQPDAPAEEEIPDWLKEIAVAVPAAEVIASAVERPAEETTLVEEPVLKPELSPEQPNIATVPLADEVPSALEERPSDEVLEAEEPPSDTNLPLAAAAPLAAEMLTEQADEPVIEQPAAVEGKVPETEKPPSDTALPLAAGALLAAEMLSNQSDETVSEMPATVEATTPEETPIPSDTPPALVIPLAAEIASTEAPFPVEEVHPQELTPQLTDQPQIDQLIPAGAESPPVEPGSMNEADAFAWLEGLAAEQDAMEEGLVSPPVEGEFQPPEWVKLELEPVTEEPAQPQPSIAPEEQALPAEEIPDWIKGLGEEPLSEPVSESPGPFAVPEPVQAVVEPTQAEPENLDELPAWILDMEQPEPEKEITGQADQELEWKLEELPDWLKEITESEGTGEVAPTKEPISAAEIAAGAVIAETAHPEEAAEEVAPKEESFSASEIAAVGVIAGLAHTEEPPLPAEPVEQVVETPQTEVSTPVEGEAELVPVSEGAFPQEAELSQVAPQQPAEVPVEIIPDPAEAVLSDARTALSQGEPSHAIELYTNLIEQNSHLGEVIKDLQDALYRFPVDIDLWVTLGDAHSHSHDLQDALNAYTKAEELVR